MGRLKEGQVVCQHVHWREADRQARTQNFALNRHLMNRLTRFNCLIRLRSHLIDALKNCSTVEKEMLAVVLCSKEFCDVLCDARKSPRTLITRISPFSLSAHNGCCIGVCVLRNSLPNCCTTLARTKHWQIVSVGCPKWTSQLRERAVLAVNS